MFANLISKVAGAFSAVKNFVMSFFKTETETTCNVHKYELIRGTKKTMVRLFENQKNVTAAVLGNLIIGTPLKTEDFGPEIHKGTAFDFGEFFDANYALVTKTIDLVLPEYYNEESPEYSEDALCILSSVIYFKIQKGGNY